MVEQHRRSRPEMAPLGTPAGPSRGTLLVVSVILVGVLSFTLGYLSRGSSDETPPADRESTAPTMDTPATPLDSTHIMESTGAAGPTPTPTPEFLFTQTLSEETSAQAPVPRSDAPPAPAVPTAPPIPEPTVAPAKPEAKPKPAVQAEPKKQTPAKASTSPAPAARPKEGEKTKESAATFYSIQIAAVGDRNQAAKMRIELGNKGYRAYVIPYMKGGVTYYRVRVGPLTSREAAAREAQKLARDGFDKVIISADKR